MGKLSLLIPSFNDSRILEILLELQNYSRQDLEVVIQDGGSSDKLLSEIKALLKSSDKLIVEKDQEFLMQLIRAFLTVQMNIF